MQEDTGCHVKLISENLGKKRLEIKEDQLKQFDASLIKTLGCFECLFKSKNRFRALRILVEDCIKDHGLLGFDILRIDTSKLVSYKKLEIT